MRRVALITLLALACTTTTASAKHTDYHPGDCHWSQQGEILDMGDHEYHCACGRLTREDGHYEVFCKWQRVDKAELRRIRKAHKHTRLIPVLLVIAHA